MKVKCACYNKFFILLIFYCFLFVQSKGQEECTIGVASGRSTTDGRPLLWKTRDNISDPNNTIKYSTSLKYKFIYIVTAGGTSDSWMGVNEHGFSIINSLSTDLPTNAKGIGNGALMKAVLGSCKTVAEFENYLKSTNVSCRSTQANFAVIDTTGVAAIFETGGSVYYKYDANDSEHGYIIRTNFSFNGGGNNGIERFNRSSNLIDDFYSGDTLNYKSIIRYQMRDFSDNNSNPVTVPYAGNESIEIPYGYIYCANSICRTSSVSTAVIHGVLPTEFARLTTMWTMLGHPATTVSIPYWPVGTTPIEAKGNPRAALCDKANEIREILFDEPAHNDYINSYKLKDGIGGGLWPFLFIVEDSIFSKTEYYMDSIRLLDKLPVNSMIDYEAINAGYLLLQLQNYLNSNINAINTIDTNELIKIYPNPAIDRVCIDCADRLNLKMHVNNLIGKSVLQRNLSNGINEINIGSLLKGMYIIHIFEPDIDFQWKLIKN